MKKITDELLDIVNEHDQVIGQQYRSQIYKQKLSCFRAINAFIINDNSQLWIPRRTSHKELFPLCLDASVGGHVRAGESYDQAFARETQEELNINISNYAYKFLAKLTPHQHNVSAYMHLYSIHTNTTPHYNPDDFIDALWIDIPTLEKAISQGERAKDDLSFLINFLKHL